MRGVSKDAPTEIQSLLISFEPYPRGNDVLCAINDLCNTSKHALIAFVGAASAHFEITGTSIEGPFELWDAPIWNRTTQDIKYARILSGTNFQHQGKLAFFIALENVEIMRGKPATAALNEMLAEASYIVTMIEDHSKRIGLIE